MTNDKRQIDWNTFWLIDVMTKGMSIKEACYKHQTNATMAYKWLKEHPSIRDAYMRSPTGRRMRWKEEKQVPRSKASKRGPWKGAKRRIGNPTRANDTSIIDHKAERKQSHRDRMEWADRAYRRYLQERREWLWWLITHHHANKSDGQGAKYIKTLEKELKQIEKDLKEIGLP